MKQKIEITVPLDWSAVTLRKYLELYRDLKQYEDDEEAKLAALFYHLCGVTPDLMMKLETETYLKIKEHLLNFINTTETELIRRFTVEDIEWGFHQDLSKIEYGAYLDLTKLNTTELNEDWAKAMAILYRPIKKSVGQLYEVQPYTGREEWEWWLDMGMDLHFGAWFFFINLSMDLLSVIPNYTMEKVIAEIGKETLVKNGVITEL